VLYDEIDTLFGPRAKENEELRGVINAGHRRGAVAGRMLPKPLRIARSRSTLFLMQQQMNNAS
jgi:hypothetical protein